MLRYIHLKFNTHISFIDYKHFYHENFALVVKFFTAFSLLICSLLFSTFTIAQQHIQSEILAQVDGFKASKIYSKAKRLRSKDVVNSQILAHEAIRVAGNNDYITRARAYRFLGELTNDRTLALEYFLNAADAFNNAKDKLNHTNALIDYVEVLLQLKRYKEADEKLVEVFAIALDYGHILSIGVTHIAMGDSYYAQKNYDDAIEQYIESLEFLYENNKSAKKYKAQAYKKTAESYKRLKNREKTAYYYKKTLDAYIDLNDKKLIARTLNTLAEAERYQGNLVLALDYSMRGLDLHNDINDPEGKAKANIGAGIVHRNIGRYEKAINHFHQAHIYYLDKNNTSQIANTSNQMGLVYTRLDQFDEAKSFYQLTIDLPKEKIELTTLATALREMAVIHLQSKQFDSAISMAKKARDIYQENNDITKESLVTRIIANIYRDQKDYSNAINYYRDSLSLAIEARSKNYQIKTQISLANVLLNSNKLETNNNANEAIDLLNKALILCNYIDDKKQKVYIYNTLRKAEKYKGNLAESLRYAEKEIELGRILQKEEEGKELSLAKANLHSYKMEIELASLREKTRLDQLELVKKNNEIEIAKQNKTITELELIKNQYASLALASLLAVCVFLVVLIYRRFVLSKQDNKQLKHLAIKDPLTNCYNRRFLFDLLDKSHLDSKFNEYCVIMADIDYFKKVNDSYGHSKGDVVLCGVANILQSCVRSDDIVARFGGEEFCIILPNTSEHQAMKIADKMLKEIENSTFGDISVTCSFGVSSIIFNASSASELIDQADSALYESKSRGRNQATLWYPKLKK